MKSFLVISVLVHLLLITVQSSKSCSDCFEMKTSVERYRDMDPTFMCSVGMHDGRVPDYHITASSKYSDFEGPEYGRLYNQPSFAASSIVGSWSPSTLAVGEWLQVNLGKPTRITGIVTQGRALNDYQQWVTLYKVSFSNDGVNFVTVRDDDEDAIFIGNKDNDTPVVNYFPLPVTAQYFRLVVQSWNRAINLRMELLVCDQNTL